MTANVTLRCCIVSALLLQGCASAPAPRALLVQPNLQLHHSSNETAEAYYQMGKRHQAQGNLDVALSGYTYAIARDPLHMEARNSAAAIHAQQGRLDQARAMILAVIADYPTASQAHNNLGYIDYLRGDHGAAVLAMRRALALDTYNERARNNLRLAETALAAATPAALPAPAPVAESALARAPAIAAAPEAPARAPRMELVEVVPNIYELKMSKALVAVALAVPMREAAAARPAAPSRLEVANGEGTPGLARRVGTMLGKHGVMVARLSNHRPFGQQATRILYRPGHLDHADAVRKLIEGPVQLVATASMTGYADVRVVLGKDTQQALAKRDAPARTERLAAR